MATTLPPIGTIDILDANADPIAATPPIYNMNIDDCEELPMENSSMRVANQVRMLVINQLTKGGKEIPADAKDVKALLAATDGLDRQAIGRLRIKTEQQMANLAAEAIAMADELFSDRDLLINRVRNGQSLETILEATVLPDDFVPIPGQTAINPPQETFESFRDRMNMGR